MNTRHDNADGPEDIDKAFAEIVAELERDAPLPQWPDGQGQIRNIDPAARERPATGDDEPEAPADPTPAPAPHETPGTGTVDGPSGPRDWTPDPSAPDSSSHGPSSHEADDEGHFEPPEPPPVPTPKAGTVGGILLILAGVALLLVPGLAGWIGTLALPTGLVSISAGIGWLLFRMRQSPPDSGWDDGAQL